jgi:phytoene dehydrogenase-like protein
MTFFIKQMVSIVFDWEIRQSGRREAYVVRLQRHCRQLGVQIRLNTPVTRLVLENGAVVGVEAGKPHAQTIRPRGFAPPDMDTAWVGLLRRAAWLQKT